MDTKHIEITRINPKRWAELHIPIGTSISIAAIVPMWAKDGYDFVSLIVLSFLILPMGVILSFLLGWISAQVINLYIKLLGKGPILETETLVEARNGDFKRNGWEK